MTYWYDTLGVPNPPVDDVLKSGNVKFFRTHNAGSGVPAFDIPYYIDQLGNSVQYWQTVTSSNLSYVSAIADYVAQELIEKNPDIPIGLMNVAWSGTNISGWIRNSSENNGENYFTANDGAIYNNHIAPLIKYNIAGIMWYQGCNDSNQPNLCKEAFPTLINDYIKLWGREDLPFFYVQLARYDSGDGTDFTAIREVQREALDLVDNKTNIGMVVSIDTDKGTSNRCHKR